MYQDTSSVSVFYARALLRGCIRLGLNTEQILLSAGLSSGLLRHSTLRITTTQLSRLIQSVWRATNDDFFALATMPVRHGVFSLYARMAVHSGSVRQAYFQLSQFYNLTTEAIDLSWQRRNNRDVLVMRLGEPHYDEMHLLTEFLILLWHRFPSWLAGQTIELESILLGYTEPAHSDEYKLMFPCPVYYGQEETALIFAAEAVDLPIIQTGVTLRQHLRRAPVDWVGQKAYTRTCTMSVIQHIQRCQDWSELTMDQVAGTLSISTRTLRRKLEEEKTSFQDLKDIVRRDLSIQLLSQGGLPIAKISEQVGFSEPAAFTRAFKGWTGVSPKTYRN